MRRFGPPAPHGREGSSASAGRMGRRPESKEPHRQRRRHRSRPHPPHRPLRHADRRVLPAEVEAVLAHELAHRCIGMSSVVCSSRARSRWERFGQPIGCSTQEPRWLGLEGPADLAGLPLFGLILMALGLVALPLANGWSRHVERQADDFALRTANDPEAFIGAMDRLAELNLAERDPHYVKEFLLYSASFCQSEDCASARDDLFASLTCHGMSRKRTSQMRSCCDKRRLPKRTGCQSGWHWTCSD